MSSYNGLAYNDLISIRDLLQRAKTKTRQKTYRTHHLEAHQASATTSETPGQLPEQPELNDGSLTSLTVPIATSLNDQHNDEAIVGPPIEEQVSRPRSRSPRVNQTYSKKRTSDAQYFLVEEPGQTCSSKKACQRPHTSSIRSVEQDLRHNDDEHGVTEECSRQKIRNPRRGACSRNVNQFFNYSHDIFSNSLFDAYMSLKLLNPKASTAPEGLTFVKSIEKPRTSRTASKVCSNVHAPGVFRRCGCANAVYLDTENEVSTHKNARLGTTQSAQG